MTVKMVLDQHLNAKRKGWVVCARGRALKNEVIEAAREARSNKATVRSLRDKKRWELLEPEMMHEAFQQYFS